MLKSQSNTAAVDIIESIHVKNVLVAPVSSQCPCLLVQRSQSVSEALDQHGIHHLLRRAGKGLTDDTPAADHETVSSCLNFSINS